MFPGGQFVKWAGFITSARPIVVCIAARVLNKMSMLTTVHVGWRQSGRGYSYNRGPTFFLNRGPARSKSGPGRNAGSRITRMLTTPGNHHRTDLRSQTMSTQRITSSTGKWQQSVGNLIGQHGESERPSEFDRKASTSWTETRGLPYCEVTLVITDTLIAVLTYLLTY